MTDIINAYKQDAKETFTDILMDNVDQDREYYNFKEYKEDMMDFTYDNIF